MDKEGARRLTREVGPVPAVVAERLQAALFAWLSGRLAATASAYLPMEGEVDITPLFDRLPGWRWVLPRVEDDGSLTFRDRAVSRERHRWGMEQPADQGPVIPVPEIDVFLVPGLGFDLSGHRLGRGGGFYDRVLATRRGDSVAIGVTLSERILETVPVDPHDEAVDWLATEEGLLRPTR